MRSEGPAVAISPNHDDEEIEENQEDSQVSIHTESRLAIPDPQDDRADSSVPRSV